MISSLPQRVDHSIRKAWPPSLIDQVTDILADLHDSGAIEQDADIVLFLYREEVNNPDTEEKGIAEVLIRKHRNGPIGDRRLTFVDRFARFEDVAP